MTNPQHEALVEAVARAISNAVDPNTGDPIGHTIHMSESDAYGAGKVAEQLEKVMATCRSAAIAALSATAATPSDEVVRLRELVRRARNNVPEFYVEWHAAARAARDPQAKDL